MKRSHSTGIWESFWPLMIIVILLYFNPLCRAEAPQMVLKVVLGCVYFNAMLWNRCMGVFLKFLFQRNTFYVKALLFTWCCRKHYHRRMLDFWVILVCNTLFPMTINMLHKQIHLLVYDQTFHVAERIRPRASLEINWRPPEEACSRLRSIVLNKY